MSMEHKAFAFDTKKFHAEIEPVMKDSIGKHVENDSTDL